MKLQKTAIVVLSVLTMVSTAALGEVVSINFEGFPYTLITTGGNTTPNPASVLTNNFISDGVIFGKAGTSSGVAVVRDGFAPSSGSNSVTGLDASGIIPGTRGACVGDIYFSFVQPGTSTPGVTNSVLFTIGDGGADLDVFQIRSYNLSNVLINTQNVSKEWRFLVTVNTPGIHRVEIDFTGDYGYSMDDLIFNAPVPEPATLLLVGLGGLILRRLKFKS